MMTKKISMLLLGLAPFGCLAHSSLISIDLGHTITKVRTAQVKNKSVIIANTYEGALVAFAYSGSIGWTNSLSGFMNHDIWCGDLTGDQADEILTANADGSIYCLNVLGELLWQFKANDAPMYSVSVIHKDGIPYVVCGGFDKNIYYLSAAGEKVKTIESHAYSQEKPWNWGTLIAPARNEHTVNFIRPIKRADGTEIVGVVGQIAQTSSGSLYQFEPLADTPFKITKLKAARRSVGDFRTCDLDGDGAEEVLLGTTGMKPDSVVVNLDLATEAQSAIDLNKLRKGVDGFGYRVVQPEIIPAGDRYQYYILFGSSTLLVGPDMNIDQAEILSSRYSFNDMWKDPATGRIILASAQSGGSCVHIIDPANPDWKMAYENLTPPGNIARILKNTEKTRADLGVFSKPKWERPTLPVYFMSESFPTDFSQKIAKNIEDNFDSPIFLGGKHQSHVEKFDRSIMGNATYEKKRDKRKKYDLTQEQVLAAITPEYKGVKGIAYWGGHGNDPNYYQSATTQKVMDAADGKKTVIIFPEIQDKTDDFDWLMDYLVYPLAEHGRDRNANLYIRSKYNFWHGDAYLSPWSKLMSGEYANVFVPALEETSCKAMDQSVAARQGIWASGAVDSWGARCARDNTSFDRSREVSHQMLPNHFLRQMVYNVSSGAQYIDNFAIDQDYMSLLWELIAKGALYVPKREEIVSFSPVHLGMTSHPDERFLEDGASAHWTVFFDPQEEAANPMVFSRLNGSWKGAPVTEWDFSRYAANVKDRHLNFLPSYENGLVMIAPPQEGVFADKNAPRGAMVDHLHPLYKSIMKEYITDGRNYYSADGAQTFAANTYYKTVESEIKKGAEKLPLTVTGDVAWVAAQTSPTHLRLTLIDNGYINPSAKTATVTFHTVQPKRLVDLLDGQSFDASDPSSVKIDIPCGMFRFIDIELTKPLK